MGADNINFKDAFFICKVTTREIEPAVIEIITPGSEDGNISPTYKIVKPAITEPALDIPFPIYYRITVENNVCYYHLLPESLIGKDVLVYAHVLIKDEPAAKAFSGYIGNKWKDCTKENKVPSALWSLTREDAYNQWNKSIDDSVSISKYDGKDKVEIVHPYLADDEKEK